MGMCKETEQMHAQIRSSGKNKLSSKCLILYGVTSNNCKLVIILFSDSFLYITSIITDSNCISMSDITSMFHTVIIFVIADIKWYFIWNVSVCLWSTYKITHG